MKGPFITNEEGNTLIEKIKNIFCKKDIRFFDIAVGYFYASGYSLIKDSLKKVEKIRVLFGMDFFLENLQLIEEDMHNGKILIRRYPKKLHSKIYIFREKEEHDKGYSTVITGSSNLTKAGLRENFEFNVELENHIEFVTEFFEKLWKEGEEIDLNSYYFENKALKRRYDREIWRFFLERVFNKVEPLEREYDNNDKRIIRQLGFGHFVTEEKICLLEVEITDSNVNFTENNERLHDSIKETYKNIFDQDKVCGILVWYYSPSKSSYCLSFIERPESVRGGAAETDYKRIYYVLGNENVKIASDWIGELMKKEDKTLEDISKLFSVKALDEAFFQGYKKLYEQFVEYLLKEKKVEFGSPMEEVDKETSNQEQRVRNFVKKMMGRIVFLHFLQKKGWMGCPVESSKWQGGNENFMYELFQKYPNKDRFYSECLSELFFNTLNKNGRPDDIFKFTGTRVPYLNGGLFDRDSEETLQIDFP